MCNLFKQMLSGRLIMIGSGVNAKSMAYAGNASGSTRHCLQKPAGMHMYNHIDALEFDLNSLVGVIREKFFGLTGAGLTVPAAIGLLIGRLSDLVSAATGVSMPISFITIQKSLANVKL